MAFILLFLGNLKAIHHQQAELGFSAFNVNARVWSSKSLNPGVIVIDKTSFSVVVARDRQLLSLRRAARSDSVVC